MNIISVILALALAAALIAVWRQRRRITDLIDAASVLRIEQRRTAAAAEQAERDRAQLLRAVEGIPVGTIVVSDGGDIVFASEAAQRFVNARHGDAVAEVLMRRLAQQAAHDKAVVEDEVEVYASGNTHLSVRAVPVSDVVGVSALVFIQDVTVQHRVEAMRQDFVANASHELKTPLGALKLLAETLEGETDPETQQRLIVRIGEEATRMSQLIDDVLDLSHVETDDFEPERIDLSNVVRAAVKLVCPLAEEQGVEVKVVLPASEVVVLGDRRQLESAVVNLAENAVKYTAAAEREGGGAVGIELTLQREVASITVTDQGIGIAEQHQERIFERFYRVDRGRRRETGGSGLGLSIVKHVAINHGGDVAVASQPGVGSVFTLMVPVANEAEERGDP